MRMRVFQGGLIGEDAGFFGGDNVPDDGYAVLVVDAIAVEREARSRPPGSDCEA